MTMMTMPQIIPGSPLQSHRKEHRACQLPVALPRDLELVMEDRILVDALLPALVAARGGGQLALERLDEIVRHRLAGVLRPAQVDEPAETERIHVRARHEGHGDRAEPERPGHLVV